jgi:glycosyltransferase involved in cell wall biosynthesis
MKYSIITPTRDEGKYIEQTILSIVHQEFKPEEWFIMDDNSKDNTREIIEQYSSLYPFIKYTFLKNFRPELINTGGRVAAILNLGDSLRSREVDLLAKIDADTSFDPAFFTHIMREFESDPTLGIASGHLVENGIPEPISDRKAGRGASLILRYTCFIQIGKFYESKTRGEDVLAFVAARALNWKTRTFDYYFNHLKPEGIRKTSLGNHLVTGTYKGSIPYWFPFFLGNVIRDTIKKPYLVGSLVQLYGYLLSRFIYRYRPFPEFVCRQFRKEQRLKLKAMIGF